MAMISSVTELEEKRRKAKEAAMRRSKANLNMPGHQPGGGVLLPAAPARPDSPMQMQADIEALKGATPQAIAAGKSFERAGQEMRRPEVAMEMQKEQAKKAPKEVAKAKMEKADEKPAGKAESSLDMSALAGATDNNILSGALMGSKFGAPGAIAGAGLGVLKNLAARKQKKKQLKAEAIKGQAAAFQKAAEQEQDALKTMMAALRQSLIF